MKTKLALVALSFTLGLSTSTLGCASSTAGEPVQASSQAAMSEAPRAPDLEGTWAFVLASSDVAAPVRERCRKTTDGDDGKAKACWNEIATQAAKEKIRFATDGRGHTVWTSFETAEGKESVYVQVPVELTADGPQHVLAKVAGEPRGEMAAKFAASSTNVMRIEVVDLRTIAMNDPKKGRLVYTKE